MILIYSTIYFYCICEVIFGGNKRIIIHGLSMIIYDNDTLNDHNYLWSGHDYLWSDHDYLWSNHDYLQVVMVYKDHNIFMAVHQGFTLIIVYL